MLNEGNIVEFMGLHMHAWTMQESVSRIARRIGAGETTRHCVVNVSKLVTARKNLVLKASIEACDIVNIDGMGVVWGARLCGRPVPERVTGIDLMQNLLDISRLHGWRIYVLGAEEDVLAQAVERIHQRWPGINIVGHHHGYFGPEEVETIVNTIASLDVDVLFVALSSPRKEDFISQWGNCTKARCIMGIGGSLDIVGGKTRRAPPWMQKTGLEWVFRLIQEPRRMAKRYVTTNTLFLFFLIIELTGWHQL